MTPSTMLVHALAEIDGWDVPAAAVAVIGPDGVPVRHGETTRPQPIASLSKPLTAATVLLEVASGRLDLDEPVGPTADRGATLRHLLGHAGGLGFEQDDRTMDPGRRRLYSNWGYEVAAAHAADRAGMAFPQLLQERLAGPLGMASTLLDGSPAHAATSTVDDLVRFAHELVVPRTLDADTHRLLTEPAFPDLDGVLPGFGRQRPNGWSLGLEVRGSKDPHWSGTRLSPSTVGHFGRSGSLLWADPVHGVALATLSGRDFDDWARAAWPALNDAVIEAISAATDARPDGS